MKKESTSSDRTFGVVLYDRSKVQANYRLSRSEASKPIMNFVLEGVKRIMPDQTMNIEKITLGDGVTPLTLDHTHSNSNSTHPQFIVHGKFREQFEAQIADMSAIMEKKSKEMLEDFNSKLEAAKEKRDKKITILEKSISDLNVKVADLEADNKLLFDLFVKPMQSVMRAEVISRLRSHFIYSVTGNFPNDGDVGRRWADTVSDISKEEWISFLDCFADDEILKVMVRSADGITTPRNHAAHEAYIRNRAALERAVNEAPTHNLQWKRALNLLDKWSVVHAGAKKAAESGAEVDSATENAAGAADAGGAK